MTERQMAGRYGALGFVLSLLGVPMYVYLPNYFADNWQVSLGLVGAVMMGARLLDMLTDPVAGSVSDALLPWMARKKQMLVGVVCLLVGVLGLFFPVVAWLQAAPAVYLAVMTTVAFLGWTLVSVPHQALLADFAPKSHQKTQLTSAREAFGIVGVVSVLALPYGMGLAPTDPQVFAVIAGMVAVGLGLGTWALWSLPVASSQGASMRVAGNADITGQWRALWQGYVWLWQSQRWSYRWMGPYFLNNLANAFPATLFLLFVTHALGLSAQAGLLLLVYFLSGLLALPVWLMLAHRWGHLQAWRWSLMGALVGFSGLIWVEAGNFYGYLAVCVLSGLSLGADMALPAAMQAQVVQTLREQGEEMAGRLFGLWGLLTKLALAVAVGVALPLLDIWGVSEGTPLAIDALWVMYAGVPWGLKVVTLVWLYRLKVVSH